MKKDRKEVKLLFTNSDGVQCEHTFKNREIAEEWIALEDHVFPGFVNNPTIQEVDNSKQ